MAISPNSANKIATDPTGNWRRRASWAAHLSILLFASAATMGRSAHGQDSRSDHAAQSQEVEWTQLNRGAREANQRGAFSEGVELATRALAVAEAAFGPDDPNTFESVYILARLYDRQGRDVEAEPLYLRALEGQERVLGREHPDTFPSVNDLALMYYEQARYAEAEPLFGRALEARERVLGSEHLDTLSSVNNLAASYNEQGHYPQAEPLFLRALEASDRLLGREHPNTVIAVSNMALFYSRQGRSAEAEPLYLRALETRERLLGREHLDTLLSVNNLARLYASQGRYAEAEALDLRALQARERLLGREHPDTLRSISSLALLYGRQGRFAEAEPLFLRALEASERLLGREHHETLNSLDNLARLYASQGRYAEAEPLLLRALEASERLRGRDHPNTLNPVNNLALLYESQGRLAEAEPLFLRVLEASERVLGREHPETALPAAALASLRLLRPATARFAIEPARLAVASRRLRFAAGDGGYAEAQRGREQARSSDHFPLLADAAWAAAAARPDDRTGLTGEAFAALQDAQAGTTSRAVIQMAVQRFADQTGSNIGALVRERDGLSGQWSVNSQAYAGALAQSGTDAEQLRQRLRAQRDAIEARMDEIDASLRRDFPQYFALVRPEALDVAATQALLAPDEAILMVVPTQFGTHVMAVSRTGFQWVRSEWTQGQVNDAVAILLRDIAVTMADEGYTYDRRTAHALYRQLVVPVASVLEGKRHVFVAAAGSLTGMPFGILVTEAPQGADDDPQALRTTRWFADAHALINIPSIQSLQFLRRFGGGARPAGESSASFVGFGDPVLQGQAMARGRGRGGGASLASVFSGRQTRSGGALADISQIRRLARLPGTAVELENMRAALRAPAASLFLAGRATEHALRAMDLSGTRVLVLATHGLVAGEVQGASEPGLIFTPPDIATEQDDGFLTASEVSALRLDADWVILSACNTAAGDGSAGAPGLSGLARAFFYAGARNLLASHWPVVDEAAPRLTVRAIELMRENPALSRAEALQRSMREIREDSDPAHDAWAHPGVWAPFSLIGDGAR